MPWTGAHVQLANMGGFVVRFRRVLSFECRVDVEVPQEDIPCVVDERCCQRKCYSEWVGLRLTITSGDTIQLWCRLVPMRFCGLKCTTERRPKPVERRPVSKQHHPMRIDSLNDKFKSSVQTRSTLSLPPHLGAMRDSLKHSMHCEARSPTPLPVHMCSKSGSSGHAESEFYRGLPSARVSSIIRSVRRSGRGCPHDLRIHRWSGRTHWQLDAINIAIARAAITTLGMQHLQTDSLARKFLSDPVTWLTNLRALCGDRWFLDANQLAIARELGIIDALPYVSEDEIDDLNKSNVFVKVLSVSQIIWLCIQLGTRLGHKIPTTQLEIVTLAFTVCSMITYGLLYSRPKDVQTVREISAARYPAPAEMSLIANVGPAFFGSRRCDLAIPNNAVAWTDSPYMLLSCMLALIIFGSLHFIAWNYDFPTQIEKTLWRASIIVTIAALPVMSWDSLLFLLNNTTFRSKTLSRSLMYKTERAAQFRAIVSFVVVLPLFVAARLFILAEAVRSLAYQPPEAFRNTWAASVPHVA